MKKTITNKKNWVIVKLSEVVARSGEQDMEGSPGPRTIYSEFRA